MSIRAFAYDRAWIVACAVGSMRNCLNSCILCTVLDRFASVYRCFCMTTLATACAIVLLVVRSLCTNRTALTLLHCCSTVLSQQRVISCASVKGGSSAH
jgi:hypothetical protein